MKLLITSIILALSLNASPLEKDYVNKYCKGIKEYVLDDDTRVDCITRKVAYEFDFIRKWYEAIGQSLYYSYKTNKQAGIYIIVNDKEDNKKVDRLKLICDKYNIKLNVIYDYRGN